MMREPDWADTASRSVENERAKKIILVLRIVYNFFADHGDDLDFIHPLVSPVF